MKHVLTLLVALGLAAGCGELIAQEDDAYAGAFLEIPVGAKALGLGGAFTAVADDGSAFYWNPSGVSLIDHKLFSGMYSSQYGGIGSPLADFYHLGYTMPVNSFGFSVNWVRVAVSDIPRYDDLTVFQSLKARYDNVKKATSDATFSDAEDAFIFSLARNNTFKIDLGGSNSAIPIEIPVGINFKMIRQSLATLSASGIGFDAGAMLRFNLKDIFSDRWPQVSLGVTMKDIGGTHITWSQTGRPQRLPQSVSYGFAVSQPLEFIDSRLVLSGDHSTRYGEESIGMEVEYHRQFGFRLGANHRSLTVGAGVDFKIFHVDYSYLADNDESQLGQVHRLGLSFNLDRLLENREK